MNWKAELVKAIIVSLCYILFFVISEILHRKTRLSVELTRKLVHFSSGMLAMFFPVIFTFRLTVFILCLLFVVLILTGKKRGIINGVTGIERETDGELYFPVAVFLLFALGKNVPIIYAISIAVMALSDPIAAIIGKVYGYIKYRVQYQDKSTEGSISFLFITFLVVHIPLLLLTDISRLNSLLLSFIVALLVTALELISLKGSDNILVPFGTFFILFKLSQKPTEEIILQVTTLSLIIIVSFILGLRIKKISFSGLITLILASYAAWSLAGFFYYIPIVLFFVGFVFMNFIFYIEPAEESRTFRVSSLLRIFLIPMLIVFAANILSKERFLYLAFLCSAGVHFTLLWRHWFIDGRLRSRFFAKQKKFFGNIGFLFSCIFILVIPQALFKPYNNLFFSLIFIFGCILSDIIYTTIIRRFIGNPTYNLNRSLRNIISLFIVLMVLILQLMEVLRV
jgi:dolichol kinase